MTASGPQIITFFIALQHETHGLVYDNPKSFSGSDKMVVIAKTRRKKYGIKENQNQAQSL